MNRFLVCLVVVVAAVLDDAACFDCPKDGQFAHPEQCDKYYVCAKGKARERLCPDGLVFDDVTRLEVKCDRMFNVDCANRTKLQPPKGTHKECPRQNGVYAHPDETICETYYNCIDNEPVEMKCTPGLYFDKETANCVWPAVANREGCISVAERAAAVAAASASPSDPEEFSCPGKTTKDANGQVILHPKYPHPTDCQKFYLCLNGVEKRQLACDEDEVYNLKTEQCDKPKNVEGCEHWYEDEETAEKSEDSRK